MSEIKQEKSSVKRQCVFETLKDAPGPMTVYDILQKVNNDKQTAGLATIYRAIKRFLKSGDIKVVKLPDGQTRYTIPTLKHLHYFLCRICKIALYVDHCCIHLKQDELNGHLVKDHEIAMVGVCKECR